MRVLVAFDKFKDALSARAACEVAATALRTAHPDWTLDLCPLTDGGEGFAETLTGAAAGRLELNEVSGPRGLRLPAPVGYLDAERIPAAARALLPGAPATGRAAVIGLASASGIELLPRDQRDPWRTTTLGTGELVACAAAKQPGFILLGVGGSATNDLGLGALAALGFKFFTRSGTPVAVPTPDQWTRIARIEPPALELPPVFITGDGRFDATSLGGKGPGSLVAEARRLGKPAHVFAGSLGLAPSSELHAITPLDLPLAAALPRTAELLAA